MNRSCNCLKPILKSYLVDMLEACPPRMGFFSEWRMARRMTGVLSRIKLHAAADPYTASLVPRTASPTQSEQWDTDRSNGTSKLRISAAVSQKHSAGLHQLIRAIGLWLSSSFWARLISWYYFFYILRAVCSEKLMRYKFIRHKRKSLSY